MSESLAGRGETEGGMDIVSTFLEASRQERSVV